MLLWIRISNCRNRGKSPSIRIFCVFAKTYKVVNREIPELRKFHLFYLIIKWSIIVIVLYFKCLLFSSFWTDSTVYIITITIYYFSLFQCFIFPCLFILFYYSYFFLLLFLSNRIRYIRHHSKSTQFFSLMLFILWTLWMPSRWRINRILTYPSIYIAYKQTTHLHKKRLESVLIRISR